MNAKEGLLQYGNLPHFHADLAIQGSARSYNLMNLLLCPQARHCWASCMPRDFAAFAAPHTSCALQFCTSLWTERHVEEHLNHAALESHCQLSG